jgi:predicted TIM-barrel fold metal-dependent hydrolase
MAEISKASGGRIGICAVVDPSLGADSLPGEGTFKQRLSVLGAEAIRIFPTHLRVAFHPLYWDEIFEAANELSMPVIIDENYCPEQVSEVFYQLPDMASKYPNIKFIVIRYGINGGRNIMPLLCKCKNVYFTIEKMLDYMQIEEIYENAGCDKLLFGSEYPELKPAGTLGLVMYADIPESEREKILYKNWEDIRYDHS